MPKAWYFFMGSDPLAAESYHYVSKHSCLCGDTICSIYVYNNGNKPVSPLSENMQLYIKDALATGQLQPAKPYHAKKYVYLRDNV
jgi:hypothetical protein